MAEVQTTRLRFISARDPDSLSEALDLLPFKVEIKGPPQYAKGLWFLWFVIPELPGLNFVNKKDI